MDFVDTENIYLLGSSMGGATVASASVTRCTDKNRQTIYIGSIIIRKVKADIITKRILGGNTHYEKSAGGRNRTF